MLKFKFSDFLRRMNTRWTFFFFFFKCYLDFFCTSYLYVSSRNEFRWVSPLLVSDVQDSKLLGGQAAASISPVVFGQCRFPWLRDEPEEAQCDFHTVPRPPDPSKHRTLHTHIHTHTHTHTLDHKSEASMCVCMCLCVRLTFKEMNGLNILCSLIHTHMLSLTCQPYTHIHTHLYTHTEACRALRLRDSCSFSS